MTKQLKLILALLAVVSFSGCGTVDATYTSAKGMGQAAIGGVGNVVGNGAADVGRSLGVASSAAGKVVSGGGAIVGGGLDLVGGMVKGVDVNKIPDNLSYQAIVMVGLYGAAVTHHGNVRAWNQWLQRDTLIIEDAAQHWLSADGTRTGRGGAAISFDPMKNLACYGNGGAVVTDDLNLAEYARAWRDNGKPTHHNPGTNSRMSELDCAHMLIKAKHIDSWQARRQKIADHWCDRFKHADIRCLIDDSNAHNHAFHKFVIDINGRDTLKANLALRKIDTRVHYANPLHEMPLYRAYPGPDMLAASSSLARRVLSLPIYPELTDLEVEYISDQVLDCVS